MGTHRVHHWRGARIEEITTSSLRFGRFRCTPEQPFFRDENRSGPDALLVFPTLPVAVRQAGHPEFVVNRHTVILRNPEQTYHLKAMVPQGDSCTWIAVPHAILARLGTDQPFDAPRAWLSESGFLAQRTAVYAALSARLTLETEETLVQVIATCLRMPRPSCSSRNIARAAEALLSTRFRERLTLNEMATAIGCSPWHLARVFKGETGQTLHGYRDQLRLRAAVDRLQDPSVDLAMLALELGYASHSHFTDRFRAAFGVPPSSARAALAPPQQQG